MPGGPATADTDLPGLPDSPGRIDRPGVAPIGGEVLQPDRAGVRWREPGGVVVADGADGVNLRRADAVLPAEGSTASP